MGGKKIKESANISDTDIYLAGEWHPKENSVHSIFIHFEFKWPVLQWLLNIKQPCTECELQPYLI